MKGGLSFMIAHQNLEMFYDKINAKFIRYNLVKIFAEIMI